MGNQSKQGGNHEDPSVPVPKNLNQAHHQRGTQPRGAWRSNAEAPGTTQLVSTPREVSNICPPRSSPLEGGLEYAPPSALVEHLLSHPPTCPEPTTHNPLPDITWESFRNTLKRSKPNKAGERDFRNNYTLHIPPPPMQQFVWRVCNQYLHQPLPEKSHEANIILLCKNGDVMNSVNYRPIALLNSVYKIIAIHADPELLAAAIEHSIIHPTCSASFRTADARTTSPTFCQNCGSQLQSLHRLQQGFPIPSLTPLLSRC